MALLPVIMPKQSITNRSQELIARYGFTPGFYLQGLIIKSIFETGLLLDINKTVMHLIDNITVFLLIYKISYRKSIDL